MNSPRSPRPKVVFVNRYFHPDQSATSQILSDLALQLARRGLDVHVVCSRQLYGDASADLPCAEVIGEVRVHRVWSTRFGRQGLPGRALDYATFYLSSLVAMLRLARRGDTLVAKTDPPMLSIPAMCAAWLTGATLVNWLQDLFPEVATGLDANPLPRRLDDWLRRLRDRSLRAARMNVVLGRRMYALLESRGIPAAKLRVIENWADVHTHALGVESSNLRKRQELHGKLVIAYSGNLGRAHEFDTLLGAARRLMDRRDIIFLMIGGGAGMSLLKQAVLTQGLDNFRFLSYQPREMLSDSLAAADAHLVILRPAMEGLIVPSKFYGIIAAARPVIFIGDPDGEIARIVREERAGVTAACGDAEGLADAILRLGDDPQARMEMGARGAHLYAERHGLAHAVDAWLQILDAETAPDCVTPASDLHDALPRAP